MTSWAAFAADAPDLAQKVRDRFASAKHCTPATLRRDGSPRVSGTEVEFADGEVWLGSSPYIPFTFTIADAESIRQAKRALHEAERDGRSVATLRARARLRVARWQKRG